MMNKAESVPAYIAAFPKETQTLLKQMREVIANTAPQANEEISYGMPAYRLGKVLVYFAGYKNHIGFYPTGSGIAHFQKDISKYKNSKGAVQFPLDKPLPLKLIERIVKFRLKEVSEAAKAKKKK